LKLHIGKPDAAARESILAAQLSDRTHKLSDDHIAKLAAATDGKVAADLELLVNRATKAALSRRGEVIRYSDFD
jgi:ATP-dependent Zn protease